MITLHYDYLGHDLILKVMTWLHLIATFIHQPSSNAMFLLEDLQACTTYWKVCWS